MSMGMVAVLFGIGVIGLGLLYVFFDREMSDDDSLIEHLEAFDRFCREQHERCAVLNSHCCDYINSLSKAENDKMIMLRGLMVALDEIRESVADLRSAGNLNEAKEILDSNFPALDPDSPNPTHRAIGRVGEIEQDIEDLIQTLGKAVMEASGSVNALSASKRSRKATITDLRRLGIKWDDTDDGQQNC